MTTPRLRLCRTRIVTAARELADDSGVNQLTLRDVARRLHTGQASLYRHIANRDELLEWLTEDLLVGFPVGDPGMSPRRRLEDQWRQVHRYVMQHRWAAEIIVDRNLLSDADMPFVTSMLTTFGEIGIGTELATRTMRTLFNLVLGFVVNHHPLGGHESTPAGQQAADEDAFDWAMRNLLDAVTAPS